MEERKQFDNVQEARDSAPTLPGVRPLKAKRPHRVKYGRGFTLVEILVVFFIMTTIVSMILPDYFAYQETIDLNNISHEVALAIREVQVYGFGSKVDIAPSGTASFDYSYGVEFDIASPTSFKLFVDRDGGGFIDDPTDPCDGTGECIGTYALKNEFVISNLCVAWRDPVEYAFLGKTQSIDCPGNSDPLGGPSLPTLRYLDITYDRASLEATILAFDESRGSLNLSPGGDEKQNAARIVVESPSHRVQAIEVGIMGKIRVKANE